MEVLRVAKLTKVYGTGHTAVTALREFSLVAHTGELIAVLGPSGSGKTTLVTAIAGIIEPTSGVICIGDTPVFDDGWLVRDMRAFRREHVGFVFQAHNLIPFLTAHENVLVALEINGI